jgi:hypothetical protein
MKRIRMAERIESGSPLRLRDRIVNAVFRWFMLLLAAFITWWGYGGYGVDQ